MKKIFTVVIVIILALGAASRAADAAAFQETPSEHAARMQWFRDAKFGMFIHWGLYSQLAGEWQGQTVTGGAEWIQNYLHIPSSQYSPLAKTWDPSKYNAREWVRLMKAAGIKYICITTKHHDGFCLWPTKMNDDWNISLTPGGQDLLKPLADACHAEGLQFCIYHSVMDWHHPDWPNRPAFNDYAQGQPDKARFKKYLHGQLNELFSNYGPIGMVWYDGSWDREVWTSDDGKALEDYTRSLQPSVILNNRSGYLPPQPKLNIAVANSYSYTFAGDYISPEGEVPSTGLPGIDWETCQTMQLPNNWGYNRLVGFRPFNDLLRHLIDVTSKGGNMLLNVGPTAEGEILPQARECLKKFAAWMKVNSEAIHGTTASPFERLPFDGRCTQKPGKLFLHVFKWPTDGKLIVPITNQVKRAYLLAMPKKNLAVTATAKGLQVDLPAAAPDPIASVVVVEIEGPVALVAVHGAEAPVPFGPVPSWRQLAWHELEFSGFVHFSINTFTDKEWGYGDESPALFNPTDFSAEQIVRTAQAAGMKGLILTCKHHDGFCLWPSKFTEHSVKNSPWKNGKGDVVQEISDACRKAGLKFGVYLSPWDRNRADYGTPEYIAYYRNQLRELLTNYGPISEVWFDGANGGDGYYGGARTNRIIDRKTYYDWPNTWQLVRELQPGACIFGDGGPDIRWVGNERGQAGETCWATLTRDDFAPGSADQKRRTHGDRPGTHWIPAECDVSIRPGWFYHTNEDSKVKTPAQLMDLYFASVGRGASFLLNLPPDRRGCIPDADVKSLAEFHRRLEAMFAHDLARDANVTASNIRGGDARFAAKNVTDALRNTYWATDDAVTNAELVLDFGKPVTFNIVRLREHLPLGQRVDAFALDQWKDDGWVEFATGTSIGSGRLVRGQKVTTEKVRLRTTAAGPAISELGVFEE